MQYIGIFRFVWGKYFFCLYILFFCCIVVLFYRQVYEQFETDEQFVTVCNGERIIWGSLTYEGGTNLQQKTQFSTNIGDMSRVLT